MTPSEDRARLLFLDALTRPPDEWGAFLDASCETDSVLRARVDQLLSAHVAMASIPDSETNVSINGIDESATENVGSLIGSYRLLERIGEGGFGVVYMAEQVAPVRRKVALKIIKPGMDTRQVVARFEAERQALALMDHPNIARVFDGGMTATGRPFFVMELVRGIPITEFCDQNALSIRERFELFVLVCNAVQHAHQKGIIHRDLKPNNVMVTLFDDRRVVKVIDFGIAKAVGQQLTEKTLFTNFTQFIGTPPYMSPEQAQMSGLDIDTRSDIYSLGVLLYELLTGTTPFDKQRLRTVAFDEIRRIIREEDPPKPSTRLSALGETATTVSAQRGSDRGQLREVFRRELDWVVMKCLEKDRNRRYETANGLAMDVLRYLKNEPVSACPPSTIYRIRSFVRRHRASLTTAGLVVAIAMVGGATTLWQAFRATSARDEALQARLTLTKNQQAAAEERANAFARDLDTLGSANRLIQSGRFRFDLGEIAQARADVSEAIEIRPDHSYAWLTRGEFYAKLGLWDLAGADYQRGYQLRAPESISLLSQQAAFCFYCGDEAGYRGACERLAARTETLDQRSCDEISRACLLAKQSVLDPEQLIRIAERAVSLTRRSVEVANLGVAHYRAEQYERAIDRLHEARAARTRTNYVWTDSVLAMAHHRLGQSELARKYLDSATESLVHDIHSPGLRFASIWWYNLLAELYYREATLLIEGKPRPESAGQWTTRGERLAAFGLHAEALASYDRAAEATPGSAFGWEKKAALRAQLGDWGKAVHDYERLLSLQPDRADAANTLAGILASCPESNLRQPERAVELAGKAVALAPLQAAYWRTLGIARYRAKDLRGSEQAMLKAMELNPAGHPVDRLFLAMALWESDQKRQAEQLYNHTVLRDDWPAETVDEFSRYAKEAAALLGRPGKPASLPGTHGDADPSIYTILLEIDLESTWLYERRGYANAMLKQWDQAAADFHRAATAHPEDPRLWYGQAVAKLGANDPEGYRQIREEIFARYEMTSMPGVANHVLYICLVTQVTKSEAETLVRWGHLAVRLTPDNPRARGAAFFRFGDYESAVRDLTEASKKFPPRAWDSLFLAMAHQKLGHSEEARESLKKAEEWVERVNRSGSTLVGGPWISWYESVEVACLLREARAMIQAHE